MVSGRSADQREATTARHDPYTPSPLREGHQKNTAWWPDRGMSREAVTVPVMDRDAYLTRLRADVASFAGLLDEGK